jgi:GT2 family glycosyltransferase
MRVLLRILAGLPLLLLSPILILLPYVALALTDLIWAVAGRRRPPANSLPGTHAATVVIPNWNGRDLLEKYLPSVLEALSGNPANEVIVVDNGSADASAEYVNAAFPQVKVVAMPRTLGFGGGSNEGFRRATNDIVVLLNSDMRVEKDFLAPLLAGFTDESVFAVSCQIFLSDPSRRREETGLTQGWWDGGRLRVRHRIDNGVSSLFPCFYGGGGSCAFDRRKFLELGGFDPLLAPFYLEDTDLGFMAWKRGWKVLYEPRSVVYHEHRGTIGKKFSPEYIQTVLHKNFLLFCWKNIHSFSTISRHFLVGWADSVVSLFFGDSPERSSLRSLWKAFLAIPRAMQSRWRARSLSVTTDEEAFRRPLGGYFRDRFERVDPTVDKLNVLFVSPYPICPPVHGGGVFMYQTCSELARLSHLHLIALLDFEHERAAHDELATQCKSAEFLIRMKGSVHGFTSVTPHAVAEFCNPDLEWLIHRQIFTKKVDVVQLEYLTMGQYAAAFRQIPSILFEHDIYFQSIGRQLPNMKSLIVRAKARFEYLKSFRYELDLLPRMDRIQVCSADNAAYLCEFAPGLRERIDDDLRAGIDTSRYVRADSPREPDTMLFLGGFRHLPNQEALEWFTRYVMPEILKARPSARLVVIGSEPPPRHSLPDLGSALELRGFVEDVNQPLMQYAVFVCPILSGSGVRVKLLEAFAAGIPVVSTRIGAEGLASADGEICRLADDPKDFAGAVVRLFDDQAEAVRLATRAREYVERERDMRVLTARLEQSYRAAIQKKLRKE